MHATTKSGAASFSSPTNLYFSSKAAVNNSRFGSEDAEIF